MFRLLSALKLKYLLYHHISPVAAVDMQISAFLSPCTKCGVKQQIIPSVIIEFVGGGCLGCSECSGRVLIAISTHMVLVWWIRHPQFCLRYFRKVIHRHITNDNPCYLANKVCKQFLSYSKGKRKQLLSESIHVNIADVYCWWRTGRYLGHISPWSITTQDTAERCGALS